MKALNTLKVAVGTLLLFLLTTQASANYFLNSDRFIIDQRLQQHIPVIGGELKAKTNVSAYVYIKSSYGISQDASMKEKFNFIKEQESNLIKGLKEPYVVLTISLEEQHANLLFSKQLNGILDKDEILDDYVIPILASKDKNELYAKASAAVLNGYGQITDTVAKSKGVKLENSIGSGGKTAGTIWKVFMYFIVISGLLAYVYAVLKHRK